MNPNEESWLVGIATAAVLVVFMVAGFVFASGAAHTLCVLARGCQ